MIAILIVLVALSAFFSATETAFTSLNRIRLKNKADAGDRRAAQALYLVDRYDNLLSTILVGNNIVNLSASSLGTVFFTVGPGMKNGAWGGTPGALARVLKLIPGGPADQNL